MAKITLTDEEAKYQYNANKRRIERMESLISQRDDKGRKKLISINNKIGKALGFWWNKMGTRIQLKTHNYYYAVPIMSKTFPYKIIKHKLKKLNSVEDIKEARYNGWSTAKKSK